MQCLICHLEFRDMRSVMKHVHFKHKTYTTKTYYDEFLRSNGEGICECGTETTFRGAGQGYLEFCSHTCFANSEKTRVNMSAKASGKKQTDLTIQKRIANTDQQTKEERRKLTCLKRHGVDNPILVPGALDKVRNTCFVKYGVRSPTQRSNSMHGKWKNVLIGDRKFRVQGYEDLFLQNHNDFNFSIDQLAHGKKNCPTVPWTDHNNVTHMYFPDFYVQDQNLLIEIKSAWTFEKNEESTLLKLDAAKKMGFKTMCIIFSSRNDKNPRIIK